MTTSARRWAAGAATALLVAGCGSDTAEYDSEDYGSTWGLAAALGCASSHEPQDAMLMRTTASDVAQCHVNGGRVTIVRDDAEVAVQNTVDATRLLRDAAGESLAVVSGDNWAVMTESRWLASILQRRVGGRLSWTRCYDYCPSLVVAPSFQP